MSPDLASRTCTMIGPACVLASSWPCDWPGADDRLRDVVGSLVKLTLQQRDAARARRDYATADAIRDGLEEIGVLVEDTPEGPRWELKR